MTWKAPQLVACSAAALSSAIAALTCCQAPARVVAASAGFHSVDDRSGRLVLKR
jgi:hypothetical protein